MQKLIKRLAGLTTSTAIALTGIVMLHKQAVAQSYDIDCKVILCLAGGFPSGCSDAFDYMIDRILLSHQNLLLGSALVLMVSIMTATKPTFSF